MYDYAIVGGGIAGLTTAEIFTRSGFKVILLEKNSKICSESSGTHHEWFHFGSLYSLFQNKNFLKILVGGIDDLLLYYRDFLNMNIKVNTKGKLLIESKRTSWFKSNNFKYLLKNNLYKKTNLKNYKKFSEIHSNFKNYDWRRGESSKYILNLKKNNKKKINKKKIIKVYNKSFLSIDSFDCPMDSTLIIRDLLSNFINYGGKLKTRFNVKKLVEKKGYQILNDNNRNKIKAKNIIFANGSGINSFLKKDIVKSYISPLMITYPQVFNKNYIHMTDNKNDAINHVTHNKNNKKYSIIGGGSYIDLGSSKKLVNRLSNNLFKLAEKTFGSLQKKKNHIYFGVKNEVIKNQKRNYIYTIKKINKNVYYINPGKFSLSFSLAINTFKKVIGHYPNPTTFHQKINKGLNKYIKGNYHKNYISKNFS